jgi:hypothetical protein
VTLATRIVVVDPIDPKVVFDRCLELLGRDIEGTPYVDEKPGSYSTRFGQGLAAWCIVNYAVDGPIHHYTEGFAKELKDDDPEWEPPWYNEHCVDITFDTAYGYKSPSGAGCSDLHAWFIRELAVLFEEKGVKKWVWNQEFTGEWYGPDDPVTHLGTPTRGELPETRHRQVTA